jgi:hypothetical protein
MAKKIEILEDDMAFDRFAELASGRTHQIAAKQPLDSFLVKNKDEVSTEEIVRAFEAVV